MSNINNSNWPLYIQKKFALRDAVYKDPGKVQSPVPDATSFIKAVDAVDWVYAVLTTLDAKASALMRLNGVLIAAAAFLLGQFGRPDPTVLSRTPFDAAAIVICAFLSAVSITYCLMVVNVSWDFLGKVKQTNGDFDFSDEIRELDATCTKRQTYYQNAWRFSCAAIFGFLAEFGWQTVIVIYTVFFR